MTAVAGFGAAPAWAQSTTPAGWVLDWADEFDGTALDAAAWNVENGNGTFGGDAMVFRPANVTVSNGILRLQARREASGGRAYTSGAVTTRNKQTFGPEFRLEVRARIPAFRGGWSAIWTREGLMPDPDIGVEIDLMENIGDGNVVYQTQHTWNAPAHQQVIQCAPYKAGYASSMHTYTVEVSGGQTRWFIDGVQTCGPSAVVPTTYSHLIMNLSLGGSWPGPPDSAGAFPQNFDIDYVRVYRRGTGSADTTVPTVSLTAPAVNSTVNGTTTLTATASDNVGVAGVWFTVDGASVGAEDTSAPYQAVWNSASVATGTHTIRAVARDAAGNTTTSAPVTVTVNNTSSDTTAPSVSLTAPAAGATVSGTVTVAASATDNVGVSSVQFTLNGVNLGAPDTSAPYSINWSTTGAANGTHTLRAIARDAAGNATTAAARTVNVSNQASAPSDTSSPSVSLTAPSWGATVGGTVTVAASAADNVGVTAVQFTLDGANLGAADTTAPYAISWNTAGTSNGNHTLRAIARDAAGNTRTSWARTVTVSNTAQDTTAPTVSLTAPAAGATVGGTVTVTASAADNVGIVSVQFTLDGVNLGAADSSAPYSINWDTRGAANGTHVLQAVARDAAGNTRASSRTVTVSNSTGTRWWYRRR